MLFEVKDLCFAYHGHGKCVEALQSINLSIESGDFVAIAGPSGSGKSTLLLLLDGLLKPSSGKVLFHSEDIHARNYNLKRLRRKVGMLFQFSEHNLFGRTVFEDVCYGLRNHGYTGSGVHRGVYEALEMVGLSPEVAGKSLFALSGGEKRKVALAGILALKPEILLLDEPTAGLDPGSRLDLLEVFRKLSENGTTIIAVTHDTEEIAELYKRIIIVDAGKVAVDGETRNVFNENDLSNWSLETPDPVRLAKALGLNSTGRILLKEQEVVQGILEQIRNQ